MSIRQAQRAIWPLLQESLDIVQVNREAVEKHPESATKSQRTRAKRPWTRVVADEALWAAAKAGFLATPEQAAVVQAAREWAESWPKPPTLSAGDDPEDVALYKAVQDLATSFNPQEETP